MNNYRVETANKGSKWRRLITSIAAAIIFIVVLGTGTISWAFPETAATVTARSANIRSAADPTSTILASVKQGDVVSVFGEATGTDGIKWYHMHVDANTQGYIRSDLVSLGQGSLTANTTTTTTTTAPSTTTTTTTNLPETQVTPVEAKQATVQTNNVRIRKGASTDYGIVATANRGMVVSVTGEAKAADGKTWYQVSFTYDNKQITGFIRSDLVTFETLPADTTTSQIGGTTVPEQPEVEQTVEPQPQPEPETTVQEPEKEEPVETVTLMNSEKKPYVPGGFVEAILKWKDASGQTVDINAYKNGAFYIFYANRNGEVGWYLYDAEEGEYMRYVYESATATIPEDKSVGMAPIIILAIFVVVLLAVVALLFLKLREYTADYDYDDDDEDEDDDDDDDSKGSRQPQRTVQPSAPVRRPVSNTGAPRPTSNNARPAVRNVARPVSEEAQNVQERTRENVRDRSKEDSQQRTQVRRPSAQPRGTKAKSFLDADNDMEFIEI